MHVSHPLPLQTLSVQDMTQVSACGWLLSVLRAPTGTGIYSPRHNAQSSSSASMGSANSLSGSAHTLSSSCAVLSSNGLDETLGAVLEIVHQSSVDDVVAHIGIKQFAAKVRATNQLKRLYTAWVTVYYPVLPMPLLEGSNRDSSDKAWAIDSSSSSGSGSSSGRDVDRDSIRTDDMCAHLMHVLETSCLHKKSSR